MLPTLNGRIQTRIFVLARGRRPVDAADHAAAARAPAPLADAYTTTFVVLLTVAVLGVGWELVYHLLQQFRWEKDWPTFFGLITAINEGVLVWLLLEAGAVPGIDGPVPLVGVPASSSSRPGWSCG